MDWSFPAKGVQDSLYDGWLFPLRLIRGWRGGVVLGFSGKHAQDIADRSCRVVQRRNESLLLHLRYGLQIRSEFGLFESTGNDCRQHELARAIRKGSVQEASRPRTSNLIAERFREDCSHFHINGLRGQVRSTGCGEISSAS